MAEHKPRARWQDYILAFLPGGLTILAGELRNRDADNVGADDDIAKLITELAPIVPQLIEGETLNDTAADRTFLTIYRVSEAYLRRRGKLPERT